MSVDRRAWWLLAAGVGVTLGLREWARRSSEISLNGKVAAVTGGSRGLGLVLARRLVDAGAAVAICARDEEELRRARQDLVERGGRVYAHVCDLTDRDDVERWLAAVRQDLGPVDVLINNAGLIEVGPFENQTLDDFRAAMDLHFWAPLYTTLAVLPEMRRRREGRIVNIASIGGKISVPHLLPYSASKFALVGLSEGLRAELAKDGVRVTTVCPGLMRTGSPVQARFKGQTEPEYTWFMLSDSLPGISIPAERAADQILAATRRGDAEVILSVVAQLGATIHGIAPGLVADVLGQVNRLLPSPGGNGSRSVRGAECENSVTQSPLTALTQRAAAANNEG